MKPFAYPITSNTADASSVMPEWIRLPRPGQLEPRTGLGRGVLSRLAAEKRIQSISLRNEGKKRGCKLIHLGSLLSYLSSLAEKEAA